jgi:hypothetical protein
MVDPLAVSASLEARSKLGLLSLVACDAGNYTVADVHPEQALAPAVVDAGRRYDSLVKRGGHSSPLRVLKVIALKELNTTLLGVVVDMLDSPDGVPGRRVIHGGDKIVVQFTAELFQLMPGGYDLLRWSFGRKVREHISGRLGVGLAPVSMDALMQARDPFCNLAHLRIFTANDLGSNQVADSFSVFKELHVLLGDPHVFDDCNSPLQYNLWTLLYKRNTAAWLAHVAPPFVF